MSRIDYLSRLFGTVRQELKSSETRKTKSSSSSNKTQKKASLQEFTQTLSERIDKLEDINLEQATHIFVKSLLAWEFGYEIMDDSEYNKLVDKITNNIKRDEQAQKILKQAFKINGLT